MRLADAVGLAAAASLFPRRRGRKPSVAELARWADPRKGCRPAGPCGPRIVLRTIRRRGARLTLPVWVEDFRVACLRVAALARRVGPTPTPRALPAPVDGGCHA